VWGGLNVLMVSRAAVLFGRYLSRRSPVPAVKYCGTVADGKAGSSDVDDSL
jgi:hypothetical protein